MMVGRCRNSVWQRDDFSSCFQEDYLQILLPLIAVGLSLVYIVLRSLYKYSTFDGAPTIDPIGVPGEEPVTAYKDDPEEAIATPHNEEDHEAVLALRKVQSSASRLQLDRPRAQTFSILVEALLSLALAALALRVVSRGQTHTRKPLLGLAQVVAWLYIFLLVCVRLWAARRTIKHLPSLWYQTAWLYGVQWTTSALVFRSVLVHWDSHSHQTQTVVQFCLTTCLALIALTARKGNKVVLLQYEGEIEPSKEPLANLFSTWTYSWIDPIVWRGYKKTLELADVWNLEARDKAAAVLADFRQLQKTSSLAAHMLKYFKRDLVVQALWAGLSGLLTFAPTLLMKAFLEFVERPGDTPVNAAWFYMVLLAVASCAKSVTDGQALWMGRKVCIRLRAVIVGEIYAKALRRKAASTRDSALGEKKTKARVQSNAANVSPADEHKRSQTSDTQANIGTIINLMAVDSFKVSEISAYLHFLWGSTPVQLVVCILLLYRILGLSSLAGIVLMIMVLPVNLLIARQFTRFQKKVMAATDVRIHSTNEILQNIRIIKYFAWEQRFNNIVGEKRRAELRALRNKYILWTAAAGVWFGLPILITFFSFLLYTKVQKRPLYPSVAFTALSLFGILRYPLDQLADMVAHVQESKVSIDRVEEFLNEGETEKYDQLQHGSTNEDPRLGLDDATLTWGDKNAVAHDTSVAFRLIGVDVHFLPGQLNIISGPTGSGKTSLLMALLGEMTLLSGKVHLPGLGSRENLVPASPHGLTESIAYCAQQAWLVNDTIKENIVFASQFDKRRYAAVIEACALQRDLEILDSGDQTLVGEKGISLSGGQKQRISLARALYSRARHVLLDDCLSAVDSHTAKHIFEHCILGPLMWNRTCILVTHNVALCVPRSRYVVVLNNGKVTAQGKPDAVIASGALGEDILKSRPGSKIGSKALSRISSVASLDAKKNGHTNGNAFGSDNPRDRANSDFKDHTATEKPTNKLTETKASGSVNLEVIQMYAKSMGPWSYWLLALAAFTFQQMASVGANVWIKLWANTYVDNDRDVEITTFRNRTSHLSHVTHGISLSSSQPPRSGPFWNIQFASSRPTPAGPSGRNESYYLAVYAILGLTFITISLMREWLIFWGSLRASERLHSTLLRAITRARLQFFDTTPLGQLMNRFSKDIEAVDQDLAPIAVGVLGCLFSLISIVVLICVITPKFLIAGFFITLIYVAIGALYIRSSRDLKRLESVQRSPIYQHFGETLSGAVTIRAYADERRFIRDNQLKVDTHNRPFIYLWATNRWLALRVDFAGALVAFFAGAFVILSIQRIDAGSAGLSLTYAVMFTENMLWLVRLYSANEQNMNSVERIKEYIETKQERPAIVEDCRPPNGWPHAGAIAFKNYTTRYRQDLEPVLKNLSFNILAAERVGIVGRTGAGKSSLALALFRGLEADGGAISIDEVEIDQIGLQDLREAITIVPQDPTLFTGTLRSNLDPFDLFTDEEIFAALRRVQLIGNSATENEASSSGSPAPPMVLTPPKSAGSSSSRTISNDEADLYKKATNTRENSNIFYDLSSPIAESGSNLSQGQRQLLCLARALLKSPRVLIMDEATASIDYTTDAKLQQTLRDVHGSTIITIAHRLQTIIDYDKILVLDKGELVEFDAPWNLIGIEDGIFRGMCETSGDFETLLQAAEEAGSRRKLVDVS